MGKVDCLIHYSRTINIACLVMEKEKKTKPEQYNMDYINGLFRCVLATRRRMFSYQCCITLSFIHRNKMCLRVSFFFNLSFI